MIRCPRCTTPLPDPRRQHRQSAYELLGHAPSEGTNPPSGEGARHCTRCGRSWWVEDGQVVDELASDGR